MNRRKQVISRISSFPTIPVVAQKLLTLIQDRDAGAKEIGDIIQYDPALTANVLKAANSAFLGFSDPVSSLAEASFRIGTKWVTQIALSSLIYSNLNKPVPGYGLSAEDLWKHSIAVALLCENLSKLLGIKDTGSIYTAGLIHDIGKLVTAPEVLDNFEEIQDNIDDEHISFEQAEAMVLGVDHAEAGALIAEHWSFPKGMVDAIRWHHQPALAEAPSQAIDLVHVADAISLLEGFGLGNDGLQYRCCEESLERLELNSQIVEKAASQLIESYEKIEKMFIETPAPSAVGR